MSVGGDLLERFGRRIRVGMVGGGADSVIGATHRIALRADGLWDLVAGALSIDPAIAVASARAELLPEERTYTDFREMASREADRDDGIDVVVIATPPQSHLVVAREFLERGIDVVCEKPMTRDAAEAEALVAAVEASGRLFALTHCYTGYPMVRHARDAIGAGDIGSVRLVEAEFANGDLGVAREPADPAARHWRFQPSSMGRAAILGEIGTHAHNLVSYVTASQVSRVSARLDTFAERRDVYDNAYLLIEFENGAVGRLWSSYVAIGNEHGLSFRVFGDEGALMWRQEDPEVLWHQQLGRPARRLSRALDSNSPTSQAATRFRPGHPEGYALAFANLYRDFAYAFLARALGEPDDLSLSRLPGVYDGLATMRLYEAAELSHNAGGRYERVAVGMPRRPGRRASPAERPEHESDPSRPEPAVADG
jgi:predicted dehydrogenase